MEIKICVDCGVGIYRWFTTWSDPSPRCERCAVKAYKAKYGYFGVGQIIGVGNFMLEFKKGNAS